MNETELVGLKSLLAGVKFENSIAQMASEHLQSRLDAEIASFHTPPPPSVEVLPNPVVMEEAS